MDATTSPTPERERRFRELYDASYADLLCFARRRVHPSHAEDIVGEVFLVAWRRLDDVPRALPDARAWLFGVGRKKILNARRREDRHDALSIRLSETGHTPADAGEHPALVACRTDVAAAWPLLSDVDQEAIALAVLDGLNSSEAAAVLGISATAFRLRLSRARRKLRHHLEGTAISEQVSLHPDSPWSSR